MTTALTWRLRLLRHRCNVARQCFCHAISRGEEPEGRPATAEKLRELAKLLNSRAHFLKMLIFSLYLRGPFVAAGLTEEESGNVSPQDFPFPK